MRIWGAIVTASPRRGTDQSCEITHQLQSCNTADLRDEVLIGMAVWGSLHSEATHQV
jgi:hypothetical protein